MRLTSWEKKGLAWGAPTELTGLQNCIKNMIGKKIKLVNVVQVMLFRRILSCQRWAFNMWEFDAAQHQALQELFDTAHKDSGRCCSSPAKSLLPLPRTVDSAPSAAPMR